MAMDRELSSDSPGTTAAVAPRSTGEESAPHVDRAIRLALAVRIETISLLRTMLPRIRAYLRGEAEPVSRGFVEELALTYGISRWALEPAIRGLMIALSEGDQPKLRWLQYPSALSTEMVDGWAAALDARGARPRYGEVELWAGARERAREGVLVTPPRPSEIDQIAAVRAATSVHADAPREAALDRLAAWYGELALRAGIPSTCLGPDEVWCPRGLRRELRTWALSALEARPSQADRYEVDRLLPALDADVPVGLVYVRTDTTGGSADSSHIGG